MQTITNEQSLSGNVCSSLVTNWCQETEDALTILTDTGIIRAVNRQCERVFGYNNNMLIGESIEKLVPALFLTDDEMLLDKLTLRTQMVTGQHITGTGIPLELTITNFYHKGVLHHLLLLHNLADTAAILAESNPLERLSPRELQVVQMVSEGYTSREIAEQLMISTKTVERHRANVMDKLNTANVVQLVRLVLQHQMGG